MNQIKFRIRLPNGEIQSSEFKGWFIRLQLFWAAGKSAAFKLSNDDLPELHMVCYECWPLPFQLEWNIQSLKFFDDGAESTMISDAEISFKCGACFIASDYNPLEDPKIPCAISGNLLFKNWGTPID